MRITTQQTRRAKVAKPLVVGAKAPRNILVLAVIARMARGGTVRHESGDARRARFAQLDLDQQVREVGEW